MKESCSKINYNYLRPKKAKVLKDWYEKKFIKKTNLCIKSFHNATILPLKRFNGDNLLFGRGGVVDEKNIYVNESAINGRVYGSYDYSNNENIKDKKVVYCGYLVSHWGHFLIEAVARLWYFLENDNNVDNYVFFINFDEQRNIQGNYKEFLELLGVWNKIEIINKPTQYREVIVPDLGYKWREYYSEQYKNIFKKISDNINKNTEWKVYDKIFFTRSKLKNIKKREFGLDMLDDYFLKNGYKIISPEKIPLSELIFYIKNAKECAAISGSLPHNMLFGNDNQNLLIVERNVLNNEIQVDINNMKGLNVTYIDANIAIYPVNLGYGPFILAYKGLLEKYTNDKNLISVSEKYKSQAFLNKCFKKYMREYRKTYHYKWFMEDWYFQYTDYIREAYLDSLNYYEKYLGGGKPFKFSQYFNLLYIKQIVKKFIKK